MPSAMHSVGPIIDPQNDRSEAKQEAFLSYIIMVLPPAGSSQKRDGADCARFRIT